MPDGEGMIGMFVYSGGSFDTREYAGIKLDEALLEDSTYRFSVRLRLSSPETVRIGSYGAYFSSDSSTNYTNVEHVMDLAPQLERNPNDIIDTPNVWYLWEDTLIADGGEEFVIIGNFLPDSLTPHFQPSWQSGGYFFVDDVKLIQIPAPKPDGINELKVSFGVSPNPSNSVVQISYTGNLRPQSLLVYTISGKEVAAFPYQKNLDVSDLPSDAYLLKVLFENGAVGTERLVVQH